MMLLLLVMSCKLQSQNTPEVQEMLENIKEHLVFVEGGTFMMGHPNVQGATVHQVTLDSYSINKYETTFKEFDIFTKTKNQELVYKDFRQNPKNGPNYGAKGMTWQQARDYCQWLGKKLETPMDLPTEAQWEYAARSRGLDVDHATNNGKIEGNYKEKRNYDGTNVEVGSYPPNPLGVYDMSGGRPEWVLDWLGPYSREPVVNPLIDSIGIFEEKRVRGWHSLSYSVYKRGSREPTATGAGVGFRCVCNQKTPIN